VLALLVTAILSPFILKVLIALKSRQTISKFIQEHAHKQGTPTMGGLIVMVGVMIAFALQWQPVLIAPSILAVGFTLLGFLDDYVLPKVKKGSRGFSWIPKLVGQIMVCVLGAWFSGEHSAKDIFLFSFVILFFCNAYNFSDGLDSLSGGLGMILAGGFLVLLFAFPVLVPVGVVTLVTICSGALIAGFIPFMFFNAPPAKVFMGDVGSMPIGAIFGLMWWKFLALIHLSFGFSGIWPLLIFAGVMFAEIIPPPLQVGWVKVFKKRLFPFKTPIHHAFQEKGWPETRIAWMFHLVQLTLVLITVGMFRFYGGLVGTWR
jgi:phospho-N-acetylmuramoyl-pentapeptide-transferase